MINELDCFRYIKKSLKVYKERILHLEDILRHYFEDENKLERPSNGFAFWIEFQESVSLTKLRQELKSRDVFLPRICMYQNQKLIALRLGFAHWNLEEMEEFVVLLRESYECTRKSNTL